eukprot:gene13678-16110_t
MIEDDSYMLHEVQKHASLDDAWVTMDGEVYDVTKFVYDHPGGSDIVQSHLGQDIGKVFLDEMEHEHSEVAYNMLLRYQIGSLKGYRKSGPTVAELIRSRAKLEAISKGTANHDDDDEQYHTIDPAMANIIDVTKAIVPQLKNLPGDIVYSSLQSPNSSYLLTLITFCFGLFFWSFIEYILHRFVFHIKTSSYWGNFAHFFIHGIHHITPYDSTRLTFPPMFSFLIASSLWNLLQKVPQSLLDNGWNTALYGGTACGYMMYDTIHYYFHHGDIPWLPNKLKEFKTNHLNHHYKDDNRNYGITSTVFDIVFGTY